MATKKSTALPEHVINAAEEPLAELARTVLLIREEVNKFSAEEKAQKEEITKESSILRKNMAENDEIIGKISIVPPNQAAVRVEFRLNNGSLDISEMDNLDKLFESARPELFEKAKIVASITDPEALVKALKKAGLDPWDYLTIGVKTGQDQIIIDKGAAITTAEAILPKRGLLATLPGLIKRFSEEGKIYIREYLRQALKPTVVLGTKIKK